MTPRSRKPVMLAIFGNSDPKSYQNNISELLEESGEVRAENASISATPQLSGDIPLNSLQLDNLPSMSESDMSSANDNGLPVVETVLSYGSTSQSTPESLSSAFMYDFNYFLIYLLKNYFSFMTFREYFNSRGNLVCEPLQDDESFSSQPDDFESSNEYQKLDSSSASSAEIEKLINQSSNMSESLLYCLDGNDVTISSPSPSPEKGRKRQLSHSVEREPSNESLKRLFLEAETTDL